MSKITTGKARFSFVNIFKPRSFEGGPEKFSLVLLIPKADAAGVAKIKAAIEEAKADGKTRLWNNKIPAKLWDPLRDGDAEKDSPEFKGHYFLNAKSNNQPGIVDRNKQEILDSTEVYSGCYGRAVLSFFPYASNGSFGVGVGLEHVQKLADGDSLGGKSRVEDEFGDPYEDEDSVF